LQAAKLGEKTVVRLWDIWQFSDMITSKKHLYLLLMVLAGTFLQLNGWAQAGGGAAGGGGGGSSSAMGLKYIIRPSFDTVPKNDFVKRAVGWFLHKTFERVISGVRTDTGYTSNSAALKQGIVLDSPYARNMARLLLHPIVPQFSYSIEKAYDTVENYRPKRTYIEWKYHYGVAKVYVPLVPPANAPGNISKDTVRPIGLDSFLLNPANRAHFHRKLKVFLTSTSKQTDSISFKVWYRKRKRTWRPLNEPNGYDEDFTFVVPYDSTTGWYRKFVLPFRTRYLVPVNIPFLYDENVKGFTSTFLNAGLAYGWAWGRTKFYKYNQLQSRNTYVGAGPFFNLSSTSGSASSSSKLDPNSVGKLMVGFHVGFNLASIQFLAAAGKYADFDNNGSLVWRARNVFGLGIGLSLFNFSVPSTTSPGGGGH
jgi:hypothetical protein